MNAIMKRRRAIMSQKKASALLYEWDFTDSLTDKIHGVVATLSGNGISRDSMGLHITGESGNCLMPDSFHTAHVRVEVDISESNAQFAYRYQRYFLNISNTSNYGAAYNSYNSYWTNYFYNAQGNSGISNANAFAGHTMVFDYDAVNHTAILKMDNTVILQSTISNSSWTPIPEGWRLGSQNSQNFYSITVTAVRIYDLDKM